MAQCAGQGPRRTGAGGRRLIRILALGDSYTIGEAVAREAAWPHLAVERMRSAGIPAVLEIIARTGWTTGELLAEIAAADPAGPCDLVTIGAGVNDQYRDLPIREFSSGIERLHDLAVHLAGGRPGRVLALSIPDWSVTPFAADTDRAAVAAAIEACNDIARSSADDRRIGWIDITTASRRAGEHPDLIAGDGLHPSPALHAEWAAAIAERLLDILDREM